MRIVVLALALAASPYDAVDRLFSPNALIREQARDELIARNDLSIAPALADAVFFNTAGRAETVAVLEHLLEEKHGPSYKKWVEAIGRREDIIPAPGYIAFKAKQVAKIDPELAKFLREDAPRTIRAEEIVWGGVKKDGIPALENPKSIDASRATWLNDDDLVFGVVIGDDVRAYPERILQWHEMANDVVGARAVSLSYCTLCGAAILYDAGEYTFGSSGFLYRSNKLMYDRQTNTLWSQLTGEPVFGPLVAKKVPPLRVLPLTVTTWREWRTMHPKTRVVSLETGHVRDYRPGAAYGKYNANADTMFPVWKKASSSLETKEWVLVVNIDSARKIYPLDDLQRALIVHDRIAGRHVILIVTSTWERAYITDGRRFRRHGNGLADETNARFVITEGALVSGSTRFERAPAHRAYWFGAYAFYPDAEVWTP